MSSCKMVIIGGSDAGVSAALRARELDPGAEVNMILADQFPNYSICGLPFYLSGEVADWKELAHRRISDIEREGIRILIRHRVTEIDPQRKQILAFNPQGRIEKIPYDRLLIATGGRSFVPDIPGADLSGVFFLRWMDDAFAFQDYLQARRPASIVIVGAGYIGMEMADAMIRRGLHVSVLEYAPSVLPTFDQGLGEVVRAELDKNGVKVYTGVSVKKIEPAGKRLAVATAGFSVEADMVLVATGSVPVADLAGSAGIATGVKGAISVNRRMETSTPDIYAAGDCAETYHALLTHNTYMPLGTSAHKQGSIAGENATGGTREYAGTLGTQSVKIFNLVAARTGLRDSEALQAGFSPLSVDIDAWDHKHYYPGAQSLKMRITGDRSTARLLGMQIIGAYGAEISKRIDIVAAAIHFGATVEALSDFDLSYTPPLSSPWDPVQTAAQEWLKAIRRS